jgi:hypothetical protein
LYQENPALVSTRVSHSLLMIWPDLPKRHQMGLIEKIENIINALLIRLQDLILLFVKKATPAKLIVLKGKLNSKKEMFFVWWNALTPKIKIWFKSLPPILKAKLAELDIKSKLLATYKKAQERTGSQIGTGKFNQVKKIIYAPFLVVGQWLQGLSALQSVLLMGFTAASILSVVNISFSGKRLLSHMDAGRNPASVEEDAAYPRPGYYKKQTRHVEFSGLRLPVYVPEVNELRTIDIDFIATLSSREAKVWLEKREFPFRDHLVMNMEPVTADFPLSEEGKEILRQKLWAETNDYLIENHIDANVVELKITYMLAN